MSQIQDTGQQPNQDELALAIARWSSKEKTVN